MKKNRFNKTTQKTLLTRAFKEFFDNEKSAGLLLLSCTVFSILAANLFDWTSYIKFWHQEIQFFSSNFKVDNIINDGLMAVFFLLVGLEIKRELAQGELSSTKKALLPLFAALGGMVIPVLIHFSLNNNTSTSSGLAIPMATDIAFAIGILSLVGKKAGLQLKILLTALAIIDDLGAILVIAIFYGNDIASNYLLISLAIFVVLLVLNLMNIRFILLYIILGIFLWYFILMSGIHPTIAGVLLAFTIPLKKHKKKSVAINLEHFLNKPVAYFILPIFAAANTAFIIGGNFSETIISNNSLGIILGLVLGKPLGIFLFCYIFIKIGLAKKSNSTSWTDIIKVGFLGGIGFTMSIFISILAFGSSYHLDESKIAIILASLISAVIGFSSIYFFPKRRAK